MVGKLKRMTEDKFIKTIQDADLWSWFSREFGENWKSSDWYSDGWWFDDNYFQYRCCDIFDDHSEGYNWSFHDNDFWRTILLYVLQSHGYRVKINSGDEDDGLFLMEPIPVKIDETISEPNDPNALPF